MRPVDSECATGQVDINTASVAAIDSVLRAPPQVVQLIVRERPWLKAIDLESVPGMVPGYAARVARRLCATQPVLPAATPLACRVGSRAVDLQSASAATMFNRLLLPDVIAQEIIDARPLPQNLNQVGSPRILALPAQLLDHMVNAGLVCVTPAPMDAGGSGWRWATPAGGAVVTRDGFSMIVPPGRITDPSGDYISVTPLADESGVLPHADYHISGNWTSGTTPVAVQGPWTGEAADAPAVFHNSSDRGLTVSVGDGTAISTVNSVPTVTALAYSLSDMIFGDSPCAARFQTTQIGGSPACAKALFDGSLAKSWQDGAFSAGQATGPSLSDQAHCLAVPTPLSLGTVGPPGDTLPWGMSCSGHGDPSNGDVTWQMTNKAYFSAALGLLNAAVLYHFSLSGAQYANPPKIDLGDAESDTLLKILVTIAHQDAHVPYLFPGETLHVDKTVGFLSTRADVTADPAATAVWGGVNNILSLLPDSAAQTQVASALGTEASLSACVAGLSNALGCIEGLVAQAVAGVIANPKLVAKAVLARVVSANLFLKAFAAVQWLGSFIAAETISNRGGDGVTLSDQPNQPTNDLEHRPALSQCLSHGDLTWSVDANCQDTLYGETGFGTRGTDGTITNDSSQVRFVLFRLDEGNQKLSQPFFIGNDPNVASDVVANGGGSDPALFDCLSRRFPLRDWLPVSDLSNYGEQESATAATCPSQVAERSLHGNETHWILRETSGHSYFVDGASILHPIDSGAVYECLAQRYYVLNATTDAEVSGFTAGDTARCT